MIRDSGLVDKVFQQRLVRRWTGQVADADLAVPRQARRGRLTRGHLGGLIPKVADLGTGPVASASRLPAPCNADWAWRPEPWSVPLPVPALRSVPNGSGLGTEVTVFHDSPLAELTVHQMRDIHEPDIVPCALCLEVFRFEGSFLSLVIDLPEAALRGLGRNHVLRMDSVLETRQPLKIFARINIEHGPNAERIVREMPIRDRNVMVEFDLAYTRLSEKWVDKAWIDLIFERPDPTRVTLHDVTFSRRPRAAL